MISTNPNLPIHTPMDPLHDECSGIANLDARGRTQKVRDNWNWFGGLITGLGWGLLAGSSLVAFIDFLTK